MLTVNLIRKFYIPFVLKALQKQKSMQETVQQSGVGSVKVVFLHRREYGLRESVIIFDQKSNLCQIYIYIYREREREREREYKEPRDGGRVLTSLHVATH